MTTQESTEYDLLGRMTSSTDVLGRVTTYAYSQDGLTVTQTVPSGATFITRSAPDGTVMEESGTGQRHVIYAIDLVSDGVRTFTKAVSGETQTELQRSIVNGAGETLRTGVPNTVGGVIYTRNTYNARGQLTKTQTDAGNAATTMAPTLWEYDAFGNKTKETWKLADPATVSNSRITTWSYGVEQARDEVYRVVTATRNNSRGTTYDETQKTLASSSRPRWKAKSFPSIPGETLPNNGANTARAPSGRRKAASPPPTSRPPLRSSTVLSSRKRTMRASRPRIPAPTRKPASSTPTPTAVATRPRRRPTSPGARSR
ncbi:RHS repeat domain-containing protein [Akkermansia muciniphila]|uniref:RHS repeat domain-containing protein n=1 Tax=Akkermansia muciniphila TaxID=239935 RepID=UPI002365099A|nr:hypothetical protein [Akkermansia muciniphila]